MVGGSNPSRGTTPNDVMAQKKREKEMIDETTTDTMPGVAVVTEALRTLTPEQRLEAMDAFCKHCGIEEQPGDRCHCWDDS